MVRINDTFDFGVHIWETTPDIIDRLASELNTLPKYLFIDKKYVKNNGSIMTLKEVLLSQDSLVIGDILQVLTNMTITDFPLWLQSRITESGNNPYILLDDSTFNINVDIIEPFIAFNIQLENLKNKPTEITHMLQFIKTNVKGRIIQTGSVWNRRGFIKKKVLHAISKNKTDIHNISTLSTTISMPHTKFQREAVSLHLEWNFTNLTLLEVFDLIVLTPDIPFACVNNLYKILRNSTPDPNWEAENGVIYFKMIVDNTIEPPTYVSMIMEVTGEPGHEIGDMYTDPLPVGKGLTETKFLQNLQGIFPSISLEKKSSDILKEKGRFYYSLGDVPLDRYIFGDLVMNDPLFSRYLAFDESSKASKGKRWSLYLHFFGEDDKSIVKANITMYRVREKDDVYKTYNYPISEFYLSVLISDVSSHENIESFTTVFGRLLRMYYTKAPDLIQYYKGLLGSGKFPEKYTERAPIIPGKKQGKPLSHIAPELFVAGYPTKCNHAPRIISEEEAKDSRNNGYDVMKYPKTVDEGFPQRWYVCDTLKKYPYPGLKKNDLPNRHIIPYLPCCLQTKQDKGEGKSASSYDHYFYDQPLVKRVGKQQDLVTRPIFINPPTRGGSLPTELDEMLNLISKEEQIFLRAGVFDSTSSFLQCVLESLLESGRQDLNKILSTDNNNTKKIISEIVGIKKKMIGDKRPSKKSDIKLWDARKKQFRKDIDMAETKLWAEREKIRVTSMNTLRMTLATPEMAESCKQEMYNYTTEEIISLIRDPDAYLDPRHFINMVERKYNCNIIILSRVKYNLMDEPIPSLVTTMTLPQHTQSYYKMKRDAVTIVLYEHMGGSTDHQTYPRCEIVAQWDTESSDVQYSYPTTSVISKNLREIYEKLRKSYTLNCPVNLTTLSKSYLTERGITPLTQEIDSYGKCRAITFTYKGDKGTFLTMPMQPMILAKGDGKVYRLSLELTKELLNLLNVEPIKETITGFYISAFTVIIEGVNISIPFTLSNNVPSGKDVEEDLAMMETEQSKLLSYIKDKRIARYLTDYIRWYYSSFLSSNGLLHTMDSLRQFVDSKIEVDPTFAYGHITKIFSEDGGASKNGKLCVKSDETLKRLIYTLRLFITQYPRQFALYRLRKSISNYYLGVGDFTRYRSQIILQGDGAIIKWIKERKKDYSIHKGVISDDSNRLTTPYFMKNDIIDKNICLVQGALSINTAIDISNQWNDTDVNNAIVINQEEQKHVDEEYTLYSYRNPTDIIVYTCEDGCYNGEDDSNQRRLIGYKDKENNLVFLSVLSLGNCDN